MHRAEPPKFGGYFPPFPLKKGGHHLDEVETLLRRRIEVVLWYQWWGANWSGGRSAKDVQLQWLAESKGREVLIKWEPWKPGHQIIQPSFAVSTIVAGVHDPYVRIWAEHLRDWGHTVSLCPMPEPNGFWNHWSSVIGKHPPADYITAWRRIHKIFCEEGADNVVWVWAPNAGEMPAENRMEAYHPGDDYVDVPGLSVYNWGTVRPWSQWRSFADIIQPHYERVSALGNQPIWITEMACAPEGGDQAAWIGAMLAYLTELPRLEVFLWFNAKKEPDWRITADPQVARQFWNE